MTLTRSSDSTRDWRRAGAIGLLVAAGVIASACGSERDRAVKHFGELICKTATDSAVIAVAVRGYIENMEPLPRRFLYLPGTDSTPPDAAIQVLGDRGPTYVYSADPKLQVPLRKLLISVGDYPTLLVAWHGLRRPDPMHPVVTLSGHFVTGMDDGRDAGTQSIALQCDSMGWHAPSAGGDSNAAH